MKPKNFESARRKFAFHRWARIFLCITLILGLNYLGMNFFWRTDLTIGNLYSLTPETREYVSKLDKPIEIFVTYGGGAGSADTERLLEDVRGILREYTYIANQFSKGSIQVQYIDVLQQRREAGMLSQRFGVQSPFVVVVAHGDRSRIIRPGELYEMKGRVPTGFLGEKVFTSAILQVSSERRPVIYFLYGHGEMRPDDPSPLRGASEFAQALLHRNYDVHLLELDSVDEIPSNADLVIVLSPQIPFDPESQEKLRRYLRPVSPRLSEDGELFDRAPGRLFLAIDPSESPHGLDELLLEWGLLIDQFMVLDANLSAQTVGGDLVVNRFGEHPITRSIRENTLPVRLGWSRPVREDMGRDTSQPIVQTPLLLSSDSSWAREFRHNDQTLFDPERDLPGPITLAMLSEKTLQQFGIQLGPKLLAFGSSDFLSNQQIGFGGNLNLTINSVRWLVDGEEQIQAPPRPIRRSLILLSERQMTQIRWILILGVPGVFIVIGFFIYLARRN